MRQTPVSWSRRRRGSRCHASSQGDLLRSLSAPLLLLRILPPRTVDPEGAQVIRRLPVGVGRELRVILKPAICLVILIVRVRGPRPPHQQVTRLRGAPSGGVSNQILKIGFISNVLIE